MMSRPLDFLEEYGSIKTEKGNETIEFVKSVVGEDLEIKLGQNVPNPFGYDFIEFYKDGKKVGEMQYMNSPQEINVFDRESFGELAYKIQDRFAELLIQQRESLTRYN